MTDSQPFHIRLNMVSKSFHYPPYHTEKNAFLHSLNIYNLLPVCHFKLFTDNLGILIK